MAEITPNYLLEWEYKAFEELLEIIKDKWKTDYKNYKKLSDINSNLLNIFENDKIGTRLLTFISKDKELADFFKRFLHELITLDPFLTRIYLYNSTMPHELPVREGIKIHHLPDKELRYLKDLFHNDFLVDSELAKSLPLKGIPLRMLFVGKLLDRLFNDFRHYWLIDKVAIDIKMNTGKEASIEELREKRVYETKEEKIFDYSPLLKITFTNSGPIYEVFNEEDFNNTNTDELSWLADELLCYFIRKAEIDKRKDEYFGDNLDTARIKYLIRYQNEDKEIPFQLLPKYKNLIEATINQKKNYYEHDEERQIATSGLLEGALSWDKDEGTAASWLKKKVGFQFKEEFEEQSTEAMLKERRKEHEYKYKSERFFKDKIKKDDFDSRGGKFDRPLSDKKTGKAIGTLKDITPNDEGLSFKLDDLLVSIEKKKEREASEEVIFEEITKDKRIKRILEQMKRDEPLLKNDQKYKERWITKIRDRIKLK